MNFDIFNRTVVIKNTFSKYFFVYQNISINYLYLAALLLTLFVGTLLAAGQAPQSCEKFS
ncbi:MAG: hypothetical protein WCM93_07210 [Bacteroidota bacterium]